MLLFSLAITWLPLGLTAIAHPTPPDDCNADSALADRLRLIDRVALRRIIADANFKKAQVQYEKKYNKHDRL